MSSVWISRRGAGGSLSGAWAVICVACPAGSRCSVSRDSIVLHGLSRDGIVFFAVPSAGEWLVSVTDGEREKSKTVAVTERGEMVRVLLRTSGESLFEPGSGAESRWRTMGSASAGSESIVLEAYTGSVVSYACLKEPVSLAGAAALTVSAVQTIVPNGADQSGMTPTKIYIVPEDTAATDVAHAVRNLAVGAGDFTGENALVLDVSDLDADRRYYVTIRTRTALNGDGVEQAPACTFTVTGAAIL